MKMEAMTMLWNETNDKGMQTDDNGMKAEDNVAKPMFPPAQN